MDTDSNGNSILRRTAYKNASNKIREIIKTIRETAEKQAKSRPECAIRRTRSSPTTASYVVKRRRQQQIKLESPTSESTPSVSGCQHGRKREIIDAKSSSEVRELKRVKSDPGDDGSNLLELKENLQDFNNLKDSEMLLELGLTCVTPVKPLVDMNGNVPWTPTWQSDDVALDLQLAIMADGDGDRPIHLSVVNGDIDIVQRLLEMMKRVGVPIDIRNFMKQTPLHLACISGHADVASVLLEAGSKPDETDRFGNNCVHLVVKYGKTQCLKLLMEQLQEEKHLFNAVNYDGQAPVHIAAVAKNEKMLKLLSTFGTDIDSQDRKTGRTCLHWAVNMASYSLTRLLVDELEADVNIVDYSQQTPLNTAQERGLCRITNLLENKSFPK